MKAIDAYDHWLRKADSPSEVHLFKACALYYLGKYAEAEEEAAQGPTNRLHTRFPPLMSFIVTLLTFFFFLTFKLKQNK